MVGAVELRLRRRTRPLEPPLVNARGSWAERVGVELSLEDGSGLRGKGEASPLPGYSTDDVDTSERALRAISPACLAEVVACDEPGEVLDLVARALPGERCAARFALETAALDRLGRRRGVPVWRLLRELAGVSPASSGERVRLAALLPSHDRRVAQAAARALLARGVRCFKLKVGPNVPSTAQLDTLNALRSELSDDVALRIDANASLDPAALAASLRELGQCSPEFLEEPIDLAQQGAALSSVLAAAALPIALDESLRALEPDALDVALDASYCDSVVLKPTTLGGFSRCLELARRAHARGLGLVVSHTFEGFVGWAACAQLALALAPARAQGLWPRAEQCPEPLRSRFIGGGELRALEQPGLGVEP
jgi:o-succinylbenzoate synthase